MVTVEQLSSFGAGLMVSQLLLISLLEKNGTLQPREFRDALAARLAAAPSSTQTAPSHLVLVELLKALGSAPPPPAKPN